MPESRTNEYRTMVVKTVTRNATGIALTFYDCITTITFDNGTLDSKGLKNIDVGDVIQIKGRLGNEDVMLATLNALTDYRRLFVAQRLLNDHNWLVKGK